MRTSLEMMRSELAERIDVILWEDWDPIGVNDVPEARDEYSSYVSDIVRFILDGANAATIAQYLENTEKLGMGIDAGSDRRKRAAEKIVGLRGTNQKT